MFSRIVSTAGTKILTALIGFAIISFNANLLGAEAVGTIALIILGVTIVILFSSLGGGSALVYLTPRIHPFKLLFSSTLWVILAATLISPILIALNWVPNEYLGSLIVLSMLRGFCHNHSAILLGKEKIHQSNWANVLEIVLLLIIVSCLYFILELQSIDDYINALIAAYSANAVLSLIFIWKYTFSDKPQSFELLSTLKSILRYSFFIQLASFFQLLNYRMGYYFLEYFTGRKSVGIYSVGVRISESLWIVGKSISTVQYARISNSSDSDYAAQLTMTLFKAISLITALLIGILLIIPEQVFTFLFSAEFSEVQNVIFWLSPGVFSLACTMAFSGYYSGIGKHHMNTTGSLTGLVVTLIAGFILIPKMGISGAALTASLSYSITLLFYFTVFFITGKGKFTMFIPTIADFQMIKEILRKWNK